ncbi:MAG TPA: transglutaminase domain-containing protein [Thermoanaerobaculia bacterium]|jgi:transglutaminase-like putative cysteine protease
MRKTVHGASILALALALGATAAAPAETPRTRDFDFTYKARVTELPADARKVDIWIPVPVSDDLQEVTVTGISTPVPYVITKDGRYGNSVLHFTVTAPQQPEIAVEMNVRVRRRESLHHDLPTGPSGEKAGKAALPADAAPWLKPDRLVPLNDRIKSLARTVTEGKRTDLEKARAIYDYVEKTMSYDKSGTGWGNGDIYWACDAKRGNCTDFHALFIGLNRAVGIPAKFEIGFPIPADRGQGEIACYHCWAEFYLKGYGWVPVDASEAWKHPDKKEYFFGALDENRVQLSIGRDVVLSPKQAGPPLNYFVYPYAEVDGKPYAKVTKSFAYKDVEAGAGG